MSGSNFSDTKGNGPDFFQYGKDMMADWLALMAGTAENDQPAADSAQVWRMMMDMWRKAAQSHIPEGMQSTVNNVFEQASHFNLFAQQFSDLVRNCRQLDIDAADWQKQLRRHFSRFQSGLRGADDNLLLQVQQQCERWWSQMFAPYMTYAADTQRMAQGGAMVGDMLGWMNGFNYPSYASAEHRHAMPGIGLMREQQEHIQQGMRLYLELQQAQTEFAGVLNEAQQRGFELMQQKLVARMERGDSIDSLRTAYDFWIESQEDAYIEVARTEKYSVAYGSLCNSLLRCRKHQMECLDQILCLLGAPSISGVRAMSAQLHQLRRGNAALMEQQREDRQQIDILSNKVRDLYAQSNAFDKDSGTARRRASMRTAKKQAAKKRVAKKRVAKKRVAKKQATKKRVAKKQATKKRVVKKRVAKKRATKKRVAKKRVAKKQATKKRTARRG